MINYELAARVHDLMTKNPFDQLKILLVEDDDILAKQLATALDAKGYPIEHVGNGEGAKSRLENSAGDYVCMVLDIGLPDIDGISILDWMKEKEIHTPVIIISGVISKDILVKLRDYKLSKVFSKPFSIRDFLDRVGEMFPTTDGEPRASQPQVEEPGPKPNSKKAASGSKVLVVEDFYLMAKQISTAFQADALPTTLVTKGEDALKELTENQDSYFCVLLDLGLPDLNGVTILKWMAREKIQIPVIVISGQLTTETLLELKTLEVGQVFSKPLDLSDLLTKVRQLKP